MCKDCTQELGYAYNFYKKVQSSEKDLLEVMGGIEEIESTGNDGAHDIKDEYGSENMTNNIDIDVEDYQIDENNIVVASIPEPQFPSTSSESTTRVIQSPKKAPTFKLMSNVINILNKVQNSSLNDSTEKLKHVESEDDIAAKRLRIIDSVDEISDTHHYIIDESKIEQDVFDNVIIENSESIDYSEQININDFVDEANELSPQSILTRKKSPIQVSGKVTQKISAFTVDPQKLNAIYLNLDKKESNSVLYQCTYCPKAFATIYHLGIHNKKAHLCQHCLQGFPKSQDLFAHIRNEHNSFKCSYCDKVLSTNSNLRAHVRKIHHVDVPNGFSVYYLNKNDGNK